MKDIDSIYVWRYNANFCLLGSQSTVDEMEKLLKESGKGIAVELEWKIYTIINNLMKGQNLRVT